MRSGARKADGAELVMGSAQLGLTYGVANRSGMPPRDTALRLVRRAADSGVAVFDTARAYGEAEECLGGALDGRHGVRTITKLAPLTGLAPDAPRDPVRAAVDASIAASLTALKTARLDCLLLHRASHIADFNGAVWERLHEHHAQGTLGSLGVSVQSPAEAFLALAQPAVRHIQLPFNILDGRWRDAGVIAALTARPDVAVHARSVFLQGLLTTDDPAIWPPIPGVEAASILAWLAQTARVHGRESAADLAFAFVRGQDWIDGVVVGMETEAQLDANLRLAARAPLASGTSAAIEAARPRVPARLLDPAQWPR